MKIVDVAISQIGTAEPSGDDKYIKYYNNLTGSSFGTTVSWCAMFVTYCARHAGVPTTVIPNFASCTTGRTWFKINGVWHSPKGFNPQAGDIIMFDWDLSGNCDHVGIVEKADKNNVYTIEGNTKGGRLVDGVRRKVYYKGYKCIAGYARPKYGNSVPTVKGDVCQVQLPVLKKGNTGEAVKTLQRLLTTKGFYCDVDGSFGTNTESRLKAFQRAVGLTADGSCGPATWTALLTKTDPKVASGTSNEAAVKSRFGLADETIKYLKQYKYGEDLLRKLATKG